jgi:serine/threonine protein kinase
VIQLLEIFSGPDGGKPVTDVYLVTERMGCDLHRIIQSQPLSIDHVRFFTAQLVEGVAFLHQSGIIHRDLKPANIFVNANCDIRIGDFGLARLVDSVNGQMMSNGYSPIDTEDKENHPTLMTEYVATRWYRPPEVLLHQPYNQGMDNWGVGCIIAEMLLRRALFPGKNSMEQLVLIMETVKDPQDRLDLLRRGGRRLVSVSSCCVSLMVLGSFECHYGNPSECETNL